jgi:protein TonB
MPDYPDFAKRSRISGLVTVEVVIDENGKVISAKAVSGPAMLQQAAINAALLAKFSPTLLSGQPVKVTGTINYNFSLQ